VLNATVPGVKNAEDVATAEGVNAVVARVATPGVKLVATRAVETNGVIDSAVVPGVNTVATLADGVSEVVVNDPTPGVSVIAVVDW
jgi:hypothetical protein